MGEVFELVLSDLADIEVAGLGVADVEAAHAGGRRHGQALGHRHADFVALHQGEHVVLGAVVGAGGIARGGAYALVLLGNQRLVAQ